MKHLIYLIASFVFAIGLMTGQVQDLVKFSTIEGEILVCILMLSITVFNFMPTLRWIEKLLNPKTW